MRFEGSSCHREQGHARRLDVVLLVCLSKQGLFRVKWPNYACFSLLSVSHLNIMRRIVSQTLTRSIE